MNESLEARRKRLIHRSVYTGMKETDILLGAFARAHVPGFTPEQLATYENLLTAGDPNILDWAIGRDEPPPEFESAVLRLLINFKLQL
ncbi:MAG: succinate dehydrogenase assembly factor 2 [Proteobacteria bacterium]|nr:succinate dehydrogenase assembly factor 2 [Pseudomonadota bacterium]